jgi:hypothetical protein
MKAREISALQNVIAYTIEKALPYESPGLEQDVKILKEYLKVMLEGDGKIKQKDFEDLWKIYPNRVGRKAAERHFFNTVKSVKDLEQIRKALENYTGSEKVQKGFIQNGSTWFNDWQSWTDPTPAMMGGAARQADAIQETEQNEIQKFLRKK